MSLSRFYVPPAEWPEDGLRLSGGEAIHCAQVLRKQVGDEIEVFDGEGTVANCCLTHVSRNVVEARLKSEVRFHPLEPRLHLIAAIIKGDRMDWLLEKAVELGASSVRLIQTANCVVRLGTNQLDRKADKWRQTMIAAAKQCHIPFLPELQTPLQFSTALAALPEGATRLIAALDEDQRTLDDVLGGLTADDIAIAIGPEGDFTSDELQLASDNGFQPVTLGPLILRAETAAITALARLTAHRRALQQVILA